MSKTATDGQGGRGGKRDGGRGRGRASERARERESGRERGRERQREADKGCLPAVVETNAFAPHAAMVYLADAGVYHLPSLGAGVLFIGHLDSRP